MLHNQPVLNFSQNIGVNFGKISLMVDDWAIDTTC
jgi:hypothetical protein